jgi:hypothetical protein
MATEHAALVISGLKRATCSLVRDYERVRFTAQLDSRVPSHFSRH